MMSKKQYEENMGILSAYLEALAEKDLSSVHPSVLSDIHFSMVDMYNDFAYIAIVAPTMAYKLNSVIQKLEEEMFKGEE